MDNGLPQGWVRADLGAVIDGFETGRNLKAHGRSARDGEYGVLKISAVTWGQFDPSENKALLPGDEPRPHELVRRGDLLITRANTTALVGAVARVEMDCSRLMLPDKILRLRYRSSVVEPAFLTYSLRSPMARRHMELNATGTSDSMRNLSQPKLEGTPLVLAPLNEQRRIVAKLEALQARSRRAREALEAVPPLLEKLRQSILAAAFRGDLTKDWREKHPDVEPASELLKRIRIERRKKWEEAELAKMKAKGKTPADDRWKAKYVEPKAVDAEGLPELPRGWGWAAWREVGFCQNGRAFPSSEYSNSGVKLLRPGNLHVSGALEWTDDNTRFMPSKWTDEYPDFLVHENELVMNLTAQSLKDEFLGRICLSSEGEECLLNQRLAKLTPVMMPTSYWLWFFKSPGFREYVDTLNTGSLIQHMFTSQLDACAVPLMPLEEARVLVDMVEAQLRGVRSTLAAVDEQSRRLPSLERALLAKAFRGELVAQDPSDETADLMLAQLRASNGSHEGKANCRSRASADGG